MAGLLDFIGNNAGSLLGGLFGAGASGDTKTGATQSRDPWGPAQPHILRNLQNEADLQSVYQKNPFNAQQQAGYNNIFADADHFRSSVAPGLMDFANRGTTGSYERQRGGAPGSAAGYGGESRPGGFRAGGQGPFSVAPYVSAAQASMASTGPMRDGSAPPTVSPSGGRFGQVDFAASNPYTNGAIKPAEQIAYEAMTGGLLGGSAPKSGGNGGQQTDHNPNWTAMGDVEKANYYADNPTMAKVTQLLQLGFSLTDIAKLQNQLYPGFVAKQQQIAHGDAFGDGPGFGSFSIGDSMNGLGPGNINQLGVNLGQFGDANTINSIANGYDGGIFAGGNGRGDGDANAGMGYGQGFGGSGWGGTTTGGY